MAGREFVEGLEEDAQIREEVGLKKAATFGVAEQAIEHSVQHRFGRVQVYGASFVPIHAILFHGGPDSLPLKVDV